MMKNICVALLAFCKFEKKDQSRYLNETWKHFYYFLQYNFSGFAVSISAEVWKASSGKGPEVFLDMNMEDLKKQCDLKKKSIQDTKIYGQYLKRYKEIQEDILKKVKADPKTNVDNLIKEQCLMHPELKKQILNVTDTLQNCLEEKDRLDKARKDKLIQKVLEIKCADLKKSKFFYSLFFTI